MNFLEAHGLVKAFRGGPPLKFLLACSAVTSTLDVYLRACAAQAGYSAQIETLAFGTLGQYLRSEPPGDVREVFVLFPWSFVPQADWRTGLPPRSVTPDEVERLIAENAALLARRRSAGFVYVPAPVPPLAANASQSRNLGNVLLACAQSLGAAVVKPSGFNLSSYFQSGNPFASQALGEVAEAIVSAAIGRAAEPKKVVVTDFDNTLWGGIVGEDGPENVSCAADGIGFPFFVYQSLLKKFRNEGVLIVGVTRNDRDLALAPFRRDDMVLREADFVAIVASYNSKSAQIAQLAANLNLKLDSFVFVDDNPVELEEVRRALPEVECVRFSADAAALPSVLSALQQLFGKEALTEEDGKRTEMYRLRAESLVPIEAAGADVRSFLESLQMTLTIKQRTYGDHARCLQLINKTNQFNLNGRRLSEQELESALLSGATLLGAALSERNGSHGEVVACLIAADGTIESLVMSCRVFQRRVEYAFAAWLASQRNPPRALRYQATERNEPVRKFIAEVAGASSDGQLVIDAARVADDLAGDLALFEIIHEPA